MQQQFKFFITSFFTGNILFFCRYYIHTISLAGIRSKEGSFSLVQLAGYYTLNNIPEGQPLSLREVRTKNAGKSITINVVKKGATNIGTPDDPANKRKANASPAKGASYTQVKPLLQKNTCAVCHNPEKNEVGPVFKEIQSALTP